MDEIDLFKFVLDTEVELKKIQDENKILRFKLNEVHQRCQQQEGVLQYTMKSKQMEESKRLKVEFRLDMALDKMRLLRQTQQSGNCSSPENVPGEGKRENFAPSPHITETVFSDIVNAYANSNGYGYVIIPEKPKE